MAKSKIITGLKQAVRHARERNMKKGVTDCNGLAGWTYDGEAGAWYFALHNRAAPPYLKQIRVEAILDLDADGRLAGVELLEPIQPSRPE